MSTPVRTGFSAFWPENEPHRAPAHAVPFREITGKNNFDIWSTKSAEAMQQVPLYYSLPTIIQKWRRVPEG